MFFALWLYLAIYLRNRIQGKSAQMLGPVRIDSNSPRYLRLLVDASAVLYFVGSLYLAGLLIFRSRIFWN